MALGNREGPRPAGLTADPASYQGSPETLSPGFSISGAAAAAGILASVETAPLVLDIGLVLLLAAGFGWAARRLGLPAVVGYLAAGLAVSPFTPGYVADREQIQLLADIGVVLLLFEVGIEVDLGRLRPRAAGPALGRARAARRHDGGLGRRPGTGRSGAARCVARRACRGDVVVGRHRQHHAVPPAHH